MFFVQFERDRESHYWGEFKSKIFAIVLFVRTHTEKESDSEGKSQYVMLRQVGVIFRHLALQNTSKRRYFERISS